MIWHRVAVTGIMELAVFYGSETEEIKLKNCGSKTTNYEGVTIILHLRSEECGILLSLAEGSCLGLNALLEVVLNGMSVFGVEISENILMWNS